MYSDGDNMSVIDVEVESLRSIYLDELDVQQDESGDVSSVAIQLYPATADNIEEQYVRMFLLFKIPPEYPESIPDIHISNPRGLLDEQIDRINENLLSIAENRKGSSMLFELIEAAKEKLTEENRPSEDCAICLYSFLDGDVFMKTECYHYFHSHCLCRYVECKLQDLKEEEEKKEPKEKTEFSNKVPCPVCRVPISFDHASQEFPEPIGVSSAVVDIDSGVLNQRDCMEKMYKKQLKQGGIIDIEAESKKYLLEISNVPDDTVGEPDTVKSGDSPKEKGADSNSNAPSVKQRSSSNTGSMNSNATSSPSKNRRPWQNRRPDKSTFGALKSNATFNDASIDESSRQKVGQDEKPYRHNRNAQNTFQNNQRTHRGPRFGGYRNDGRFQQRNNGYRQGNTRNPKQPFNNRRYYRGDRGPEEEDYHRHGRMNRNSPSTDYRGPEEEDYRRHGRMNRNSSNTDYRGDRGSEEEQYHRHSRMNRNSPSTEGNRSREDSPDGHRHNYRESVNDDRTCNNDFGSHEEQSTGLDSDDFNRVASPENSVTSVSNDLDRTSDTASSRDWSSREYPEKPAQHRYERKNNHRPPRQSGTGNRGNNMRRTYNNYNDNPKELAMDSTAGNNIRDSQPRHERSRGGYQGGRYRGGNQYGDRRWNQNWQPRQNNRSRNNPHYGHNAANEQCDQEDKTHIDSSNDHSSVFEDVSKHSSNTNGTRVSNQEFQEVEIEPPVARQMARMTVNCSNGSTTAIAPLENVFQGMCDSQTHNESQVTDFTKCGANVLRSPPGFANPLKKVVYGLPSVNPPPGFHRS